MITRLLAALFALYIVAGAPNLGNLPVAGRMAAPNAPESGQAALAKQALDFCLTHRDTCASLASGLIGAPSRTGAIAESPKAAGMQITLPQPAPELPLPPRRRGPSASGA